MSGRKQNQHKYAFQLMAKGWEERCYARSMCVCNLKDIPNLRYINSRFRYIEDRE